MFGPKGHANNSTCREYFLKPRVLAQREPVSSNLAAKGFLARAGMLSIFEASLVTFRRWHKCGGEIFVTNFHAATLYG